MAQKLSEDLFQTQSNPITCPETILDLFLSIAHAVELPGPGNIAFPWRGWQTEADGGRGWSDGVSRLEAFERANLNSVHWTPFSNNEGNSGPMSDQTDPKRAVAELVSNAIDAIIELKIEEATLKGEDLPGSPQEAIQKYFGIGENHLAKMTRSEERSLLAQRNVVLRNFSRHHLKDPNDLIIDVRDYGIGLTAEEMPCTILSTSRGAKKDKPYLIGQHGQGGASVHPFTKFTVIASLKSGTDEIAFTVVKQRWDHPGSKNPTYRYLTLKGVDGFFRVPSFQRPSDLRFPHGTLVRLVGFPIGTRLPLSDPRKGTYELLTRLFSKAMFPIWHEHRSGIITPGEHSGGEKKPPYYGNGDNVKGAINALERAHYQPGLAKKLRLAVGGRKTDMVINLGHCTPDDGSDPYDRGTIKLRWWVIQKPENGSANPLDGYIDTSNNILVTVNSQTHAELPRKYITSDFEGAGLDLLGRYMVVQLDCDSVSYRTRYELFTSNRNGLIDCQLKKQILDDLVNRMKIDKDLHRLNEELESRQDKTLLEEETFADLLQQYLHNRANFDFPTFKKRSEEKSKVKDQRSGKGGKDEDQKPIDPVEPPTYIEWVIHKSDITMWPGERYSWSFETDAHANYWNPDTLGGPYIHIRTTPKIEFRLCEAIVSGRSRCSFYCSEDALVGSKEEILVQLRSTDQKIIDQAVLTVTVIEKPNRGGSSTGEPHATQGSGPGRTPKSPNETLVNTPYLAPIPVTRADENSMWGTLGWKDDPSTCEEVGFTIRRRGGKVRVYYNAEAPFYLDIKKELDKKGKGLSDAFRLRFEIKMATLAMLILNNDTLDEDMFTEPTALSKFNLDRYSIMHSEALSAKVEVLLEQRLQRSESQNNN